MKQKIIQLVETAITEVAEDLDLEIEDIKGKEIVLFGKEGILDSMALVSLIADIEDKIADELGVDIILADERAMSATRSPFRSVSALVDYIQELMEEKKNE
jgi:acyl carrier protein